MALHKICDELSVVVFADMFEEVEAGGVEEVISWHGGYKDSDHGFEEVVSHYLAVVMFITQVYNRSEVFNRGLKKECQLTETKVESWMCVLSFMCFSGHCISRPILAAMPSERIKTLLRYECCRMKKQRISTR